MRSAFARSALLGLALAWVAPAPGHATEGAASCKVLPPGVSLLILTSPARVKSFASAVEGPAILREDDATVVFDDGRVITADPDSATRFLNELGWGNLRLDIVASFPRAARRRAVG